jgi:hypothetical protein
MNDPIVDEVRRVRDAHAARFNYDLDAIFRDIKEQEKKSGRKFVSFAPATIEPIPPLRPSGAAIPASEDTAPIEAPANGADSCRPVGPQPEETKRRLP